MDAHLFNTPEDLTCPLTQALFREPVVVSSGQMYEKEAITEVLRRQAFCPLTRTPINPRDTFPVIFKVKSAAQDYASTTILACLRRACSFECTNPVPYFRRACELADESEQSVPGVDPGIVTYTVGHENNDVYDEVALQKAAKSLYENGMLLNAAGLFFQLHRRTVFASKGAAREETPEDGEYLKRAVQAVIELDARSANGPDAEKSLPSASCILHLSLIVSSGPVAWTDVVLLVQDVCHSALPHDFAERLCERLLTSSAAAASAPGAPSGAGPSTPSAAAVPPLVDEEERVQVLLMLLRLREEAARRIQARAETHLGKVADKVARLTQDVATTKRDLEFLEGRMDSELRKARATTINNSGMTRGGTNPRSTEGESDDGTHMHPVQRFLRSPLGKITKIAAFGVGIVAGGPLAPIAKVAQFTAFGLLAIG